MGINVYEGEVVVHSEWANNVHRTCGYELKVLSRQLRAIKKLRVSAGVLDFKVFELRRGVRPTYYAAIVDYIILLLSIDPSIFM